MVQIIREVFNGSLITYLMDNNKVKNNYVAS